MQEKTLRKPHEKALRDRWEKNPETSVNKPSENPPDTTLRKP